jgi:hypothetical protein
MVFVGSLGIGVSLVLEALVGAALVSGGGTRDS